MTQNVNSIGGAAGSANDATGQLTAADYAYHAHESYQYDANGNRTSKFVDANQNGQLDAGGTDITQYT